MSAALRAEVLAAVAAEPSPTRAAVRRRNRWIGAIAAASGLGAFVIFALLASEGQLLRPGGEDVVSHRHLERSLGLVATTAGGALGVALAALWFALSRGRSMLGRSRVSLLSGIALIPLALFAWKTGCALAFDDPMAEWAARVGLKCLLLSLLLAAGPLLSFLAIRRSAPAHPALNGAAMGVASGACAWVALDLWCPVSFLPHLLLGHVLPLVILSGAGAILGAALLSLRTRRP